MKYNAGWSSHLPLLIKYLNRANGPILELGTGLFSTPVMHWLCKDQNKPLTSYETQEKYYQWNLTFQSPDHQIIKIDDWKEADLDRKWGLAFVDQEPAGARRDVIRRLAENCEYVVVHDTQPENEHEYHYSEVFPLFKYRFDYPDSPQTSVLSNFHALD